MKKVKHVFLKNRKSIAFRWTAGILAIIFMQSLLLSGILLSGGVLSQTKENAYQSFKEKNDNRRNYLQGEMKNRWTNINLYAEQISEVLTLLGTAQAPTADNINIFFKEASPILISMLRSSAATDAFIILNDDTSKDVTHSALYFRDYDPLLNNKQNSDLRLLIGPAKIAASNQTMLGDTWQYRLIADGHNEAFYRKPYDHAYLSNDMRLLGYWSQPFRLNPKGETAITYSQPIFDQMGQLRGVIGIGILLQYLNTFLPATELSNKNPLGYAIGLRSEPEQPIRLLTASSALQTQKLHSDESFSVSGCEKEMGIGLLKNHTSPKPIYACAQKLELYEHNTPFEREEWYLVGLMAEDELLDFTKKIRDLLVFSFLISIPLGAIYGILAGRRFTKPIISLVQRVRDSELSETHSFGKTGLSEIDELSGAIESANQRFMESTVKVSQIIDLVGVPIGVFEYRSDSETVFATDRLWKVLSLPEEEVEQLYRNKASFTAMLDRCMREPEPDEEHIYKIALLPPKWIEISMTTTETSTLGIAREVTTEIELRKKIMLERDYDALTKLCTNQLFKRKVTQLLAEKGDALHTAAMIMLDLDNFKQVNDTYGHQWGDTYLKAAAQFLLQMYPGNHVVGRRSGDEFHVFLYGAQSREEILTSMRMLYDRLKKHPLTCPDGSNAPISMSAGLIWYKDQSMNCDDLLLLADQELYRAKKDYKGFFTSPDF